MYDRKFLGEMLLWVLLFVLAFEAAGWLAGHLAPGSSWRLLALAPAVLGIGGLLWAELRQIARMDELQRQKYLIATMTGSMAGVLFCALAYIGEVLVLWPRVAPIHAIAAMGLGFVAGWAGARRRYG